VLSDLCIHLATASATASIILLVEIEAGDTIDEFLIGFPSVTREHVVAFLKRAVTLAVQEAA
jgi:uncharacterized protein (DUF433 family)